MPLVDSFMVDHTKMIAPAVRKAKTMSSPSGDPVTVFDLRFVQPNEYMLSEKGIHTLEHLFAGFMRDQLNSDTIEIIDISPMGCRTGFYMSLFGTPTEEEVATAWLESMRSVILVQSEMDIPELNKYQCGTYTMHSLAEAKNIANYCLDSNIGVMKNEDLAFENGVVPAE